MGIHVQAVDQRFYTNPVIWGEDWALHFTEDCNQFSVKKFKTSSEASARRRAREALKEMSISAKLQPHVLIHSSIFPPKWDEMMDAYLFEIELKAPIPVPQKYEAVIDSPDPHSSFMAWSLEFEHYELMQLVIPDGTISPHLSAFILGRNYYDLGDAEKRRIKMKNFVLKQHPNLREIKEGRLRLTR